MAFNSSNPLLDQFWMVSPNSASQGVQDRLLIGLAKHAFSRGTVQESIPVQRSSVATELRSQFFTGFRQRDVQDDSQRRTPFKQKLGRPRVFFRPRSALKQVQPVCEQAALRMESKPALPVKTIGAYEPFLFLFRKVFPVLPGAVLGP